MQALHLSVGWGKSCPLGYSLPAKLQPSVKDTQSEKRFDAISSKRASKQASKPIRLALIKYHLIFIILKQQELVSLKKGIENSESFDVHHGVIYTRLAS